MKLTIIFSIFLTFLMVSISSFADGEIKTMISKEKPTQVTEKKSRRKKVQMCHECGKPEPECECEGEGHGAKEDH